MGKIRILIIMTNSMGFTGVSTSVLNYYNFMDKSNMQINFVVPNQVDPGLKNQIETNGGKVYEFLMRDRNPILYWKELVRIINSDKYDIVHAHGNSCTLFTEMCAAKMGGVKVRIVHSRNTSCTHIIFHHLLRPFFNRSYTHGFACGTDAGKWLFGKKPFTVLTNGNDIEKFSYNKQIRKEYRQKYNLEGKKVLGHVGSFNDQKNHAFLIDTFYELTKLDSNCILFLMGDGELRSEMEQKVKNLGIDHKVIFIGKTLEVSKWLQAMDIMILPSKFEGMPNVVIEWQIACLPSVVSDKVTRDAKLTQLVEFKPLEIGAKAWAKRINEIDIIDRDTIRESIIREIREAGFDIKENAVKLKILYENFVRNET